MKGELQFSISELPSDWWPFPYFLLFNMCTHIFTFSFFLSRKGECLGALLQTTAPIVIRALVQLWCALHSANTHHHFWNFNSDLKSFVRSHLWMELDAQLFVWVTWQQESQALWCKGLVESLATHTECKFWKQNRILFRCTYHKQNCLRNTFSQC